MKIRTEEQLPGCWVAYDEDRYDGPGSPIGTSTRSEAEAIENLLSRDDAKPLEDRERRAEQRKLLAGVIVPPAHDNDS